jgi:hypothetical protein
MRTQARAPHRTSGRGWWLRVRWGLSRPPTVRAVLGVAYTHQNGERNRVRQEPASAFRACTRGGAAQPFRQGLHSARERNGYIPFKISQNLRGRTALDENRDFGATPGSKSFACGRLAPPINNASKQTSNKQSSRGKATLFGVMNEAW